MKVIEFFYKLQVPQVAVVFSRTGIWCCMELRIQLSPVNLTRNQFLLAAWNARMGAQDQEQTSAMSVNTSEVVPAM